MERTPQFWILRLVIVILIGMIMPFIVRYLGPLGMLWLWLPILVFDVFKLVEPDKGILLGIVLAFISSMINSCILVMAFDKIRSKK